MPKEQEQTHERQTKMWSFVWNELVSTTESGLDGFMYLNVYISCFYKKKSFIILNPGFISWFIARFRYTLPRQLLKSCDVQLCCTVEVDTTKIENREYFLSKLHPIIPGVRLYQTEVIDFCEQMFAECRFWRLKADSALALGVVAQHCTAMMEKDRLGYLYFTHLWFTVLGCYSTLLISFSSHTSYRI